METNLQETSQFAMLASILAGFAFTAVVQLLSMDRKGKLMTATILLFSTSTLAFLLTLLMLVLSFAAVSELKTLPAALDNMQNYAFLLLFGAVFLFEAGIGLVGWVRSRAMGIVTTALAALTICLTSTALLTVISQFV